MMSTPSPPQQHQSQRPFKLVLHCEDGSPPYLTPNLLSKYFSSTDHLVKDHLVLGIEVRNSFVTPVYGDRKKISSKKNKRNKKPLPSHLGSDISDSSAASTKPTGYTFTGRPLREHLCLPPAYEVMTCPSFDLIDQCEANMSVVATGNEVALSTPRGFQRMPPALYRDVIEQMETPIAVGLYDETELASTNPKRAKKSVERTKTWLEKCLTESNEGKNNFERSKPKIWAAIVGGEDTDLRMDQIKHAIGLQGHNKQICGVSFIGIHHLRDRQLRNTILKSCIEAVPNDWSCSVLVANDIIQILDAAKSGVHYIGSALPTLLARSRKALILDLKGWRQLLPEANGEDAASGVEERNEERAKKRARVDGTTITRQSEGLASELNTDGTISLDDASFVKDADPFVKECACLACSQHKRAYVHHLINAKELLAEILLFVHNLHHMLVLYDELSEATIMGQQGIFTRHIEKQLVVRMSC